MATVAHIIRSHYDSPDREKLENETGQLNEDQSDRWQTESSFSAQRRTRAAPSFVPATLSYDEWGLPPSSAIEPPPHPRRELITKNNWFIRKALRSEPSTKPSSPAPSLADLLARDPPPLPSEKQYTPPVWLHIGPSNKGFSMLQRSGWNEGEGLGAHVEEMESGTPEVQQVIDLTQSDSDDESEDGFEALRNAVPRRPLPTQTPGASAAPHMQKSLLTPLPTVLKADRLGIGLKAKTEGPYKQSKKRVTYNAAALAVHIRAAEEMRRKKAEVGRGKRAFAKIRKREEDRRKLMLAYLNE
ncbi:hypothetical protein PAXINDRAFT_161871 [Paxillus involutus ATCC 200175]|nr:hypothetical protein PAXINDRAFT_161871 [Paxillus involutus ATCC 200175]